MKEFWELKMGAILIAIATFLFLFGQGGLLAIMSILVWVSVILVFLYSLFVAFKM